jgi:hypothetical protein
MKPKKAHWKTNRARLTNERQLTKVKGQTTAMMMMMTVGEQVRDERAIGYNARKKDTGKGASAATVDRATKRAPLLKLFSFKRRER